MADNTENSITENGIPEITYDLTASTVTTTATDKTLTADGEPADAAAVGERLETVEEDMADLAADFADSVKYVAPSTAPSNERKLQALANIDGVGVLDQSNVFSTSQKATARNNIGAISASEAVLLGSQTLTDPVKRQVMSNVSLVGYISQSLTTDQKAQARTNIGAASAEDITHVVKTTPQTGLSDDQKAQARTNIGAASSAEIADRVRYTADQGLNPSQKSVARSNIGAASDAEVVKNTQNQGLTDEQKGYARSNIGAASQADMTDVQSAFTNRLKDVIPYNALPVSDTYPLPIVTSGYAIRRANSCMLWRYGPLVVVTFYFEIPTTAYPAGSPIAGFMSGYEIADGSLPLAWLIGADGTTVIGLYIGEGGLCSPQNVQPGAYRGYLIYGLNNTLWPIVT